ncbi:MAG TPA: hypothetical protein VFQ05_16020 [Candidatus Eisenbacteria bacterium]|nr:hypothetical protein [Candidatus Eisenbacteria bacterium]
MNARTWLLMLWMVSGAVSAPAAQTEAPSPARPVAAKPPAKTATKQTPRKTSTATRKQAQPKSAATATEKPATTAARSAKREGTRTLQDIHIEGEIPVPQVLFITARDQRRFLDFQHRRYLRTSQQVGEQTALPSWIGVTGQQPTDARKENPR